MKPTLLRSELLQRVPGITHAFTTRVGGQSSGPFASLNLSGRVGDERANPESNRHAVLEAMGRPDATMVMLKQVHGDEIVEVTRRASRNIEADAMMTRDHGAVLAILTADCVPVLLAAPDGKVVAAVHAGWRGTRAKIVARGVARLAGCGYAPATLVAALGPGIGPCCFVVGEDTALELRQAFPATRAIFKDAQGRMVADLWQLNVEALLEAGLRAENIEQMRRCTACDPTTFFSHRRDAAVTGRQAGLISCA